MRKFCNFLGEFGAADDGRLCEGVEANVVIFDSSVRDPVLVGSVLYRSFVLV